jgi:hypothetical protein
VLRPVAGRWSGGWDGDFDRLQLAACTGPDGTGCISLTEPNHYRGCPQEGALVDVAFTGRYLRVADDRLGVGTVFAAYLVRSPYGTPVWPQSPTTSVSVVGRIAPATGPRAARCGPPPLISATLSERGVAKVRCGVPCVVGLRVQRRFYRARVEETLPAAGSATVRLPAEVLRNLGRGRASITVEVDGTPFAARTVKFA